MPSRKGSPNKNKAFLLNRLQAMYGDDFHPIMKMAENAVKLHEIAVTEPEANNLRQSIDAWDKIAQYTEPKLKAVDVTQESNTTLTHSLDKDALKELLDVIESEL